MIRKISQSQVDDTSEQGEGANDAKKGPANSSSSVSC